MSEVKKNASSRREFLKNTGRLAGAAALVGTASTHVYAGEDNTIQTVLVGCGGRGGGAAANALSVTNGPTKLVAMADVFENRLETTYRGLKSKFSDKA